MVGKKRDGVVNSCDDVRGCSGYEEVKGVAILVCREINVLMKVCCFKKGEKQGGVGCGRSINMDIEISGYYEFCWRGVEVINECG